MRKGLMVGLLALVPSFGAMAQESDLMQVEPYAPVAASTTVASAAARPVGQWKTGVMRDKDQKFVYCISETGYGNGQSLVLALNPLGQVNIGLGQPGAQNVAGADKQFTIKVDGRYARTLPARVMNPELTVISADSDPEFLAAFSTGSVMTLSEGETSVSFALKGSRAAIGSLRECVQASSSTAVAAAPAAPANAAPTVSTAENAAETEEAPIETAMTEVPAPAAPAGVPPAVPAETPVLAVETSALAAELTPPPTEDAGQPEAAPPAIPSPALPAQLKTLLDQAGLKEVTGLAATAASLPANIAWRSGKLTGGVKESMLPAGTRLDDILPSRLEEIAGQCTGKAVPKPGQLEQAGALQLQPVRLTCAEDGKTTVTGLLFVLSRDGVLSVMFNQAPNGSAGRVDKATAGLVKALKGTQG